MKENGISNKEIQSVMIGTWAWGAGMNGSKVVFGKSYDELVLKDTFEKATELGFLKWDTAAVYGMGSCEKLLGGFINGRYKIYRENGFLVENATERYIHFKKLYPDLSERVPQRHIATYLGIAPESLSRIRSAMKENETG